MELGQYQFQLFVSLVLVLTAAFVAVVWDFLRRNNEQLRAQAVELGVPREEEQRRRQVTTPCAAARVAIAPAEAAAWQTTAVATAAESKCETKAVFTQDAPGAQRRQASADTMERAPRLAGAAKVAFSPAPLAPPARMNSQPSPLPTQAPQLHTALLEAAPRVITITNTPAFGTPVRAVVTPQVTSAAQKKDWGALLAPRASASVPTASSTTAQPNIPAGLHDEGVLTRLILACQPVTGLVVSIGVTSDPTDGAVSEPVNGLIRSLIGADDFACPTGTDEFLLIYPNLNGEAAQRQLNLVAQQLWDFQLQSLGSLSILLSWGGVEVASELIDEAVASASERMNETRRGRKLLAMALRQAV